MKRLTPVVLILCLVLLIPALCTAAKNPPPKDVIPTYIKQLKNSTDVRARHDAVDKLARSKDPRALSALMDYMKTGTDAQVRLGIIQVIPKSKDPKLFDVLASLTKDKDAMIRESAIEAIGLIAARFPDAVLPRLKDPNPTIRVAVAVGLVQAGNEQGVQVLVEALKAPEPRIRSMAAQGLMHVDVPQAFEPLMSLLKDSDASVRLGAVQALGRRQDERVFDTLCDLALNDKSDAVRGAAVEMLAGYSDPKAVSVLLKVIKTDGGEIAASAAEALSYAPPGDDRRAAIPILQEALKDRNSAVRAAAARCLANMGHDPQIDEIMKGLKDDEDPQVREAASMYLETPADIVEEIEDDVISPYIEPPVPKSPDDALTQLKSPKAMNRLGAVQYLGKSKDPKVVDLLSGALNDKNACIRDEAAKALGRLDAQSAVPTLTAMLKPEGKNTISAARALQRLRQGAQAYDAIVALLKNMDPELRRQAVVVLGDMRDQRAVPLLVPLLKGGPKDVLFVETVTRALGRIGGPEVVKALVPYLKTQTGTMMNPPGYNEVVSPYDTSGPWGVYPVLGEMGDKSVVPDVIPLLKDASPQRRAAAARLLGELKDPRAVEPLIPLLKDKAEVEEMNPVSISAARALGELADARAVPGLAQAAKSTTYGLSDIVEALARIKDPGTVEPLLAIATDPKSRSYGAATWAIKALGRTGDKRAYEPLMKLLGSSFPDIKSAAIEALGDLGDPRAKEKLSALKDTRREAVVALGKLGDTSVVDQLIKLLSSEDYVSPAVEALSVLKDERARDPLLDLMTKYPSIPAVRAMAEMNETRAVHLLTALPLRTDPDTSREAIRAVAKIKRPDTALDLIRILKQSDLLMTGGWLTSLDPEMPEWSMREYDYRPELYKALAAVTGQNLGEDTAAWLNWWKTQPLGKVE